MRKRGNARRCHQGGIHYADISFTNTNDKLTNILGTVQKKMRSTKDMCKAEKANVIKYMTTTITYQNNKM